MDSEEPLVPYTPTHDNEANHTLPHYTLSFDEALKKWIDALAAESLLADSTKELDSSKVGLEKAKEDVATLDKKSSQLFKKMKVSPGSRILSKLKTRSKKENFEVSQLQKKGDFEEVHVALSEARNKVDELQSVYDSNEVELKRLTVTSESLGQCFADLRWAFQVPNMADAVLELSQVEEELTQAENIEKVRKTIADNFERARITVQHAHHYFKNCLETVDAVRGTGVGRALVGGYGEMSKNRDYQESVELAARAQVCVNETFRVLGPHQAMLPDDVKADHDALKELGLLQMSKIYGLLYGWRSARSDQVPSSLKLMLNKQERAYAHLTRLAVWVQNQSPKCKEEQEQAKKTVIEVQKRTAEVMHVIWLRSKESPESA